MTYPPAPWRLQGHAFQSIQPVDRERARALIPPELKPIPVWPGKTLGGLYLASYGPGSTLEYHELIVVAALVRCGYRVGAWISHIYVDSAASLAGGRQIWGLPKEIAQFAWEPGELGRLAVRQGERRLCTLHLNRTRGTLPLRFPLPVFSVLGPERLYFTGALTCRVGLAEARWEIPEESPFSALNLSRPWLTLAYRSLELIAPAPRRLPSPAPSDSPSGG
ncbi:MAG TPA: acetoacetate decarboxylase family protein [Chthonomonadaceae bacterium]|nr:acetoacetate decarboxylase family protein [Chthonomonadaceae bacterium]